MKSFTYSLFVGLLAFLPTYSQQVSNVNFTEIYKNTSQSTSPYFYPVLLARYEKNDTTLTPEQYKHLYYGFTQQPTYTPYEKDLRQKEFKQLIEAKNYVKAVEIGREGLKKSPFNMNYIFGMHFAYDNLGKRNESRQWLHKFERLVEVLQKSGNGKTPQTALVVTSIGDEQVYMETLGVYAKDRKLTAGVDKITLQQPNDLNQQELYFNIEPLGWSATGNKKAMPAKKGK